MLFIKNIEVFIPRKLHSPVTVHPATAAATSLLVSANRKVSTPLHIVHNIYIYRTGKSQLADLEKFLRVKFVIVDSRVRWTEYECIWYVVPCEKPGSPQAAVHRRRLRRTYFYRPGINRICAKKRPSKSIIAQVRFNRSLVG